MSLMGDNRSDEYDTLATCYESKKRTEVFPQRFLEKFLKEKKFKITVKENSSWHIFIWNLLQCEVTSRQYDNSIYN